MADPASIHRLYENSGIRQLFEEIAAELIGLAGPATIERTRDAIQLSCQPEEIGPVVLVTPEAVEFRLPTIRYVHPGLPLPSSQLWRRITFEFAPPEDLAKLIASSPVRNSRAVPQSSFAHLMKGNFVAPDLLLRLPILS
jgi:hypothetical protein